MLTMKMILITMLLMIMLGSFVMAQEGGKIDEREVIEFTPTTDTICRGDVCTKTLYSGIRNVIEDGRWKKIEEARSLMGKGFNVVFLEEDEEHFIEVLDFNYTTIRTRFWTEGFEVWPQSVPIRVIREERDEEKGENVRVEEEKERLNFNLFNQESERIIDIRLGEVLKFGGNSTTIQLQDANSENVEDDSFDEDSSRGGGEVYMIADFLAGDGEIMFIKFNITQKPT